MNQVNNQTKKKWLMYVKMHCRRGLWYRGSYHLDHDICHRVSPCSFLESPSLISLVSSKKYLSLTSLISLNIFMHAYLSYVQATFCLPKLLCFSISSHLRTQERSGHSSMGFFPSLLDHSISIAYIVLWFRLAVF